MIDRYSTKEFETIWSKTKKYETWLKIEIEVCKAMEELKLIPNGTTVNILSKNVEIHVEEIENIEKTTKHDVIAFIQFLENEIGESSRYLHFGLTSSDITDTGLSLLLKEASLTLRKKLEKLIMELSKKATKYRSTPMIGRSHGIHAQPITFGLVMSGHLAEMKRNKRRLNESIKEISVGKISGAVGAYTNISPSVESIVLQRLGLAKECTATQVIPRDRYAHLFCTLALIASGIERLATNMRHWQRTEINEVSERFDGGQKGSSAMPHKKNPITSENLCGLSRLVRSYLTPALENISLWHERDISHSSVERFIIPDSTSVVGYMIDKTTQLVIDMHVNVESMENNIEKTNGLVYSESIMLALTKKGLMRQEAYSLVQEHAFNAFKNGVSFQKLIENDERILKYLPLNEIERCFSIDEAIKWNPDIINRTIES